MAFTLGVITNNDLGQLIRVNYSRKISIIIWLTQELAIISADVQVVLGASIALEILIGLNKLIGVPFVIVFVLLILYIQELGQKILEKVFFFFVGILSITLGINFFLSAPKVTDLL